MNSFLSSSTKHILQFIEKHQVQIIILVLFISISSLLRALPYINIFLIDANLDIYFIIISLLLLFKFWDKGIIYLITVIISINFIVTVLKLDKISESIGNFIYFLAILSFFQYLFSKKK